MGPSYPTYQPLAVVDPVEITVITTSRRQVDAFIDKLREGQETVFQLTFTSLPTDSSVALEQQRLPPLELFKFPGCYRS